MRRLKYLRGGRAGPRAMPALMSACAVALSTAALPASAQSPTTGRFSLEQVEGGRAQFHRSCAQCHGRNMVNSGTTVYDLRKFPLDQPERFVSSVNQGKGNMPSFKDALTPEQVELLWAYVGTRGGKEP